MSSSRQQSGTTLLELGMVLSVSAILLTLAVPSLVEFHARSQLKGARISLFTSLQNARIHAVSYGKHVLLCPSDDGEHCADGTEWSPGWIVFVDEDRDRERSPGEALLWREAIADSRQSVTTTRGRTRIRFSPLGTAPGTNLTISLCHRGIPQTSSKLVVSNAGRTRNVVDAGPDPHCNG